MQEQKKSRPKHTERIRYFKFWKRKKERKKSRRWLMFINRNINKKKLLAGRKIRWSVLAIRSNRTRRGDIIWKEAFKVKEKKMLSYFILKLTFEFMNLFHSLLTLIISNHFYRLLSGFFSKLLYLFKLLYICLICNGWDDLIWYDMRAGIDRQSLNFDG